MAPVHSNFPSSPALISSVGDLFDFILSGPLMPKLGFSSDEVAESIDRWLRCGSQLCRLFQLKEFRLSVPEKARIYHYYVPVFIWCENMLLNHRSSFKEGDEIPPLVVSSSVLFLQNSFTFQS